MSWKIADVIDFEWLLAEDGELDQDGTSEPRPRDFPAARQPIGARGLADRKEIFWAWLQARRREIAETLPGEYFLNAWQLLVVLSALIGAGLGMSVAAALLLAYTGANR